MVFNRVRASGKEGKRMRKKAVSIFFSSIVVCCALMGCGQDENMQQVSGDYSEEAEGRTGNESGDITLSIWSGEQDEELMAALADRFIREHAYEANITIEWSPMSEGECRGNLLNNVLNAPDLYTTTDGDLRIIVAGGLPHRSIILTGSGKKIWKRQWRP